MPQSIQYEHYKKHEHCPKCFKHRDAMWIEYPYESVGTNKCECKCGWTGTVEQLISEGEYIKISKEDLLNFYKEVSVDEHTDKSYSKRTTEIFKFLGLM